MRFQLPVPYKEATPTPSAVDLSPDTEHILQALERGQRSQPQPMQPPVIVSPANRRKRNTA